MVPGQGRARYATTMPTLVCIAYSPWSIRTRFALDAMGVPYRKREFIPTLSELRLRVELRKPTGKLTVPVMLLDDGTALTDSFDIVWWDSQQSDHPLISADHLEAARHWDAVAEELLSTGRLRTTRRVLANPAALEASLPGAIRALGPLGRAIGQDAAKRLLTKYPGSDSLVRMSAALDTLRSGLTGGEDRAVAPEDRLLGHTLTYADLTCAVGLSFVRPHAKHPLHDAARACWTEPELSDTHADLLAWRDAVTTEVRSMQRKGG